MAASANGSSSKKRKKNATMACNTCRRKRNRCIVEEGANVCKGCKASGQECQFAEFDKRRDGIQELREKLSFYESMFETLKNGSTINNGKSSTGAGAAPPASTFSSSSLDHHQPPLHLNSAPALGHGHANSLDLHQQHDAFDFHVDGFPSSSAGHTNNNGPNSASSKSFFDHHQLAQGTSDNATIVRTVTPQSSVRSKRPRESPREEINGSAGAGLSHSDSQQSARVHTSNNAGGGLSRSQTTPLSGNAYEDPQTSNHHERAPSVTQPVAHRRVSARTPDMSAVMDHLAVESNGLIRAYGATSSTALAGFEEVPNQKTVYSTRRYQSSMSGKDPPREVTPPADVQPLQSSALVAAAANISALPLGTDIRTVQHLLHLYFLWAWPMFPVISRQIFMQHFSQGGQYYSPLLLNVSRHSIPPLHSLRLTLPFRQHTGTSCSRKSSFRLEGVS